MFTFVLRKSFFLTNKNRIAYTHKHKLQATRSPKAMPSPTAAWRSPQIFREFGKKKCLKEEDLQRICDNMDTTVMSMLFKPNFYNDHTALLPFLQKKCQVASPTKIKTGLFRKTPVIKLQLGVDTLMELNRNKEQVHKDDKFLIMKVVTLYQMRQHLYNSEELNQYLKEQEEMR